MTSVGCGEDQMADQQKAEPYEATQTFADGSTDRPLPVGTVTRDGIVIQAPAARAGLFAVSLPDPQIDVAGFPHELNAADVRTGQEQFNTYCMMCHGETGAGNGMIVQRGFPRPPSFYEQRLRDAAPGHVVNVITHGKGAMYPYAGRVEPEDRWRIAAYVRALQLSTDRIDPPRETTESVDREKAQVTQ